MKLINGSELRSLLPMPDEASRASLASTMAWKAIVDGDDGRQSALP